MKRYLYTAYIKDASGYQTFFVDAESKEEADIKIQDGGEIYENEVEVTDISDIEFDRMTDTNDFGPVYEDTEYKELMEKTLFDIGQFLGMDFEECRKLPGSPSDVFIDAIKKYAKQ